MKTFLRPLPYVEHQLGFAFAGIAAIQLNNSILQIHAAQIFIERLFVEHVEIEPKVFSFAGTFTETLVGRIAKAAAFKN